MELQKFIFKSGNETFIHKQSFSFTNRHNEGSICEDFVEIYPDNISISAIVGKNGSGKSQLVNELALFYHGVDERDGSSLHIYDKAENKHIVLKTGLEYHHDRNFDLIIDSCTNQYNIDKYKIFLDTALRQFYPDLSKLAIDNTCILELSNEENSFLIDYNIMPTHFQMKFIKLDKNILKSIFDNVDEPHSYYEQPEDPLVILEEFFYKMPKLVNDAIEAHDISMYLKLFDFITEHKECKSTASEIARSFVFLVARLNGEIYEEYDFLSHIKIDKASEILSNNVKYDSNYRILISLKEISNPIVMKYLCTPYFESPSFVRITNTNNKLFLEDLSSGEIRLLTLFSRSFSYLKNISEETNHVIIFDEPETYLHPDWQRSFISLVVDFFSKKRYEKHYFHIIITSHSPFILSDIQKTNIIFLDKGKNISKTVKINTFGANIHTLLSHGFFMENGLMGKFAKSRIDEVIKYLNPKKKSIIQDDKEAQSIIDIIGEPILKNTLQTMYDAKVYKDESKLDRLKKQQEKLKNEIEKIEGKKNEKS